MTKQLLICDNGANTIEMIANMSVRPPIKIADETVAAGSRKTVYLPVSAAHDQTPVTLPVHVIHGRREGPTVFISAAIHGDEVIGVEIIRRLLKTKNITSLKGTLLLVPVVNTFGFVAHSRYLPDRRDLNRCFPGNTTGSLAARLAHIFMKEVVIKSDIGIDIHSAAIHRENLPQIRVSPSSPNTMKLAQAFAAPIVLTSALREGSLRASAKEHSVDILLYEAGESLRFDETSIRVGVSGILKVLHSLNMISKKRAPKNQTTSLLSSSSYWVRSPAAGLLKSYRAIGQLIEPGETLGLLSDTLGEMETPIVAGDGGLVIGRSNLPVVNEGDALYHVARISDDAAEYLPISVLENKLDQEPLFYGDEII